MMAKFKTKKRKANVGERILITDSHITLGDYKDGEVFTVSGYFTDDAVMVTKLGLPCIFHKEYEVIVEAKPSKSERISLLESQVAELQAKVATLQKPKTTTYNNVTINVPTDESTSVFVERMKARLAELTAPKLTPNEQRKAVIERAKAFVKDTINEYQLSDSEVSFVVDEKKRSVSVTLSHLFSGKAIVKAIAKCAPDDVFNADIGKAIALGCALGLDVSEFENAVKPTEVVVGQYVDSLTFPGFAEQVVSVASGKVYVEDEDYWRVASLNKAYRITNDTKAKY